ncbi:MAG: vacuolar protein sorting-associated protein 54 [Lentinula lateritia]|nr:MAG: vacuolar protein sorting-associated protein 54 [Lentinula lateritia]
MSSDSPTSSRASTPVILTAAANASSQYDTVTPTADPSSSRYRFTYDPERRGPESISGTTTHGQDYFAAAPAGLGFHFGGSTVSLNLGALPNEWSSSKHGFHAISTVLNNPHKKQAPPKAHSALPSVMPAELPRVRRKDFDSYLQAIKPEWEKLEKSLPLNAADASQFEMQQSAGPSSNFGQSNRKGSIVSLASFSSLEPLNTSRLQALTHNQPKNLPSLESVPSVFFQSDFDLGNPQTFALITDQDQYGEGDPTIIAHSLPLLEKFSQYADTVELHLSNEIAARAPSFFAALTNLHTLQSESTATLSQISRLRQMLEQVDETVAKKGMEVISLEKRVQGVKEIERSVEGVKDVVKFTGEAREKVGNGMYGDALVILGVLDDMWNDALPTQSSLPTKPNGRLSSLPPTPEEADPESPPPEYSASPVSLTPSTTSKMKLLPSLGIPLSQLNAFSALPSHLRSLTLEIASSLSDELVSILRDDLLWRIGNGGSITTGSGKKNVSEETKNHLTELLVGLIKTRGLKEATLSYREIVFDEFRGLIRKHFSGFESESPSPTPTDPTLDHTERPQLATHLRSLSHPEFMSVIRAIYHDMLSGVEGLHVQITLLGEISESIEATERATKAARQGKSIPAPTPLSSESPSSGDSTSVTSLLLAELTDTLSSATELAHTQAAQLLSSRSEIHAGLSLPEFVELFNDTWKFVVRSEVVCRRMIVGLRGAVVSQAKAFLQTFHQSRLTQSAKLVEDEQWSPQDVSLDIQTTANIIVDAAMKDPPELILPSEAAAPTSSNSKSSSILSPFKSLLRSSSTTQNGNGTGSPSQPAVPTSITSSNSRSSSRGTATSTKKSKHIYVESNSFFTVPATSSVLSLLTDYLAVIINLGILTTDTMSRIIEFLKAFNSRTCQVVLGAGAMRSAGLKNITAKHLALASQSLSIMIALVPYIRETFRRHLNSKQAVMLIEFDKLKRDYQEHQHEIHAKLIAIMGDRLSAHIKSLQARAISPLLNPLLPHTINWNVPPAGGGVNDYIELLVKETVTLHKVLSRYLSAAVVEDVMSQVFAAINHRLSEEYSKIELPHAEAKSRLLEDVKFLHQKLSALKTIGKPSMMLETVVREKPIPKLPGAPPTPVRNGSMMSPPNSAASNASTNQRLRGLLSGRATSYDRSLPNLPGPTDRPLPPPRSNTSSPHTDSRTTENPSTPTVYRSLSPNPYQRSDRPRTPPPPPLPIDVEAEVPSPPPDGSSAFGFRQIEASHQHMEPANFDPPSSPRSPLLAFSQRLKGQGAVVGSGPSLLAPYDPILSASTPAFTSASEAVLPPTDETNRTVVSESDPSTGSLHDTADASIPTLSSSPEIEHRS